MTEDKGEQSSSSRGGHWEGPNPMTDKGAISSQIPKESSSAPED